MNRTSQITLHGQISAIVADLDPHTGGSRSWGVVKSRYVAATPTQDVIISSMTPGHEYSRRDISAFPAVRARCRTRSALKNALSLMILSGRLTARKSICRISGQHIYLYTLAQHHSEKTS